MAYPRQRKPASISASEAASLAASSSPRQGGLHYESAIRSSKSFAKVASSGRGEKGKFIPKANRNRAAYISRQIRKNSSLPGNDYQYGTREEVAARHNARYRNIRRAFGMSAG